eukprot:COSAG04_NODE_287_length_17998_cov_7.320018_18_plen_201_part_00
MMDDFLEIFLAVPLHVMVRFGRWTDILAEPLPPNTDDPESEEFERFAATLAVQRCEFSSRLAPSADASACPGCARMSLKLHVLSFLGSIVSRMALRKGLTVRAGCRREGRGACVSRACGGGGGRGGSLRAGEGQGPGHPQAHDLCDATPPLACRSACVSLASLVSLSCLCVRLSASLSLDSVSLSLCERPCHGTEQFDDI